MKISLCLFLFGFYSIAFGQELTGSASPVEAVQSQPVPPLEMGYRIEGAYSPYRFIDVKVQGNGQVILIYQLYQEPPNPDVATAENIPPERLQVTAIDPVVVDELREAYLAADFFNREVEDLNKDTITVTDVGTTTLSLKMPDQERKISYGYAKDDPFREIISVYYRILEDQLPTIGE